jgi:hypothetical protein
MTQWEHFHIALPVTEPPPDHSEKVTKRITKEVRLTMSKEAVVQHLGRTDTSRQPLPDTRSFGVVLLWIGAAIGIFCGFVLDKLFG